MANCACHPLFCSVQQTVFDTVHTAVFSDTVHTVKVVTAKVKLDSTYTIDLLNKAQQFYSDSFGDLLTVFEIFISIAVAVWGIRLYIETKGVKKIVKKATQKATEKVKKEFDERFDKQEKFVNNLKITTRDLRESVITGLFAQARQASYDNKMRLSISCLVLSEISLHFEKFFIKHLIAAVVLIDQVWKAASEQGDVKIVLGGITTCLNTLSVLLNKVEYSSNESVAQAEMKEVGEAVSMIRKLQKDLTEFLATEQK